VIEKRIKELGFELPRPMDPLLDYVSVVIHNDLAFLSGQLPKVDGELKVRGKVGDTVTEKEAEEACQICVLNLLSSLKEEISSLDRVKRIVKVTGFINSASGFTGQPDVLNAASRLLIDIFGEKGKHARSAVGAAVMPRNTPVEIEMIVSIQA